LSAQPEITQRDLQINSGDILDALGAGQAFTITRDGGEIGELIPVQPQSRIRPAGCFRHVVPQRFIC